MDISEPIRVLYEARQLPIYQNRMYETAGEARNCPKGDVVLVESLVTGLVFNRVFEPDLMLYDKSYQNEQAVSPLFRTHLDIVAAIIARTIGRHALVEIGCGKGCFLEMLLTNGYEIIGFDPAYEGNNPHVVGRYFEPGVGICATGLILRHVLEHIYDPIDFLMKIKAANGGRGRIYIEVPCFEWICKNHGWFDIFYEHVNYFRQSDFRKIFDGIIEIGHLFGGQYLYVVAELESLKVPCYDPIYSVHFPNHFMPDLARSTKRRNDEISVIWGGASKGVIFALFRERSGNPIQMVIDLNSAKQGKYLPATGLLVQSPEDGLGALPSGSTIYIMNSNYLDEIRRMSNYAYDYIGIDHDQF